MEHILLPVEFSAHTWQFFPVSMNLRRVSFFCCAPFYSSLCLPSSRPFRFFFRWLLLKEGPRLPLFVLKGLAKIVPVRFWKWRGRRRPWYSPVLRQEYGHRQVRHMESVMIPMTNWFLSSYIFGMDSSVPIGKNSGTQLVHSPLVKKHIVSVSMFIQFYARNLWGLRLFKTWMIPDDRIVMGTKFPSQVQCFWKHQLPSWPM